MPVSFLACTWFVGYYIFYIILHLIQRFGISILPTLYPIVGWSGDSAACLINLLIMIAQVLGSLYITYTFSGWLSVHLDRKVLKIEKPFKQCAKGIFLSSIFALFYSVACTWGILTKASWKPVKRNPEHIETDRVQLQQTAVINN